MKIEVSSYSQCGVDKSLEKSYKEKVNENVSQDSKVSGLDRGIKLESQLVVIVQWTLLK